MDRRSLLKIILEASLFSSIDQYVAVSNGCVDRCKKSIPNGPNYDEKVSLCSASCRVRSLYRILASLRKIQVSCAGSKDPQRCLASTDAKMRYYSNQLAVQLAHLRNAKKNLYKRQRTIPKDMSMKPSLPQDIRKIQ